MDLQFSMKIAKGPGEESMISKSQMEEEAARKRESEEAKNKEEILKMLNGG